ncbi:MAG TPA: alpha/beta hydrolase [Chryseosolibacter sp.]|nr:alpha/beta hydrolase [Chryseosolibacter sp.]
MAQSPADIRIKKDIVYSKVAGRELKLDIGQPEGDGPFPAVVFFHGGGWQQGDKWHMHKWIRKVVSAGYVGVSVAYRFAPEFKWPTQIEDAKEAVRYIRAHSKELKIDAANIGVMGESAGGYLALMVGVTSPKDSLEGHSALSQFSSEVQAVVTYFSATDFTAPRQKLNAVLEQEMQNYYKKSLAEVLADFTGAKDKADPRLKKISVLPYIDEKDPPILIFQGDADPFVSVDHAIKLKMALEKANVQHELVMVKGGGHGWTAALQEATTRQMMEFFEHTIKKAPK